VTLPAGVRAVISDRDFTIATVAGSSAMKSEETEASAEAEAPEAADGEEE
jgi:large subunit ribosomal protein L25